MVQIDWKVLLGIAAILAPFMAAAAYNAIWVLLTKHNIPDLHKRIDCMQTQRNEEMREIWSKIHEMDKEKLTRGNKIVRP